MPSKIKLTITCNGQGSIIHLQIEGSLTISIFKSDEFDNVVFFPATMEGHNPVINEVTTTMQRVDINPSMSAWQKTKLFYDELHRQYEVDEEFYHKKSLFEEAEKVSKFAQLETKKEVVTQTKLD